MRLSRATLPALMALLGCNARPVEYRSVEHWKLAIADPPIFRSSTVGKLFQEREGAIWFGSSSSGVMRYDPRSASLRIFTSADGIPEPAFSFAQDLGGDVWLAFAGKTLARYGNGDGSIRVVTKDEWAGGISDLHVDAAGALWFQLGYSSSKELVRFDPRADTHRVFSSADGAPGEPIKAFYAAPNEDVWLGTQSGIVRYEASSRSLQPVSPGDRRTGVKVRAINGEPSGAVWIGTETGAVRFDPETGRFSSITKQDGLPGSAVWRIDRAPSGALWLTTDEALARYEPTTRTIEAFAPSSGPMPDTIVAFHMGSDGAPRLWSSQGVWWIDAVSRSLQRGDGVCGLERVGAVVPEPSGLLWLISGGRLLRCDPATRSVDTLGPVDGLAATAMITTADSTGGIWFGTANGATRYNPIDGSFETWSTTDGLPNAYTRVIHEAPNGDVWMGGYDSVARYTPGRGIVESLAVGNGLGDGDVNAIHTDPDGTVWFGTKGGLTRYNPDSGAIDLFTPDEDLGDMSGLHDYDPSNQITSIYRTSGGTLLFGTKWGGLARFDASTDSMEEIIGRGVKYKGLDEDPPDPTIRHIHEDPRGTLWLWSTAQVLRYLLDAEGAPLEETREVFRGRSAGAPGRDDAGMLSRLPPGVRPESLEGIAFRHDKIPRYQLALGGGRLALSRAGGLWITSPSHPDFAPGTTLPSAPKGAQVTALEPGPPGAFWVGTAESGLALRSADGLDLRAVSLNGLPHMSVHSIAVVPGTGGRVVWIGTGRGAARVSAVGPAGAPPTALRVERTVAPEDGVPARPISAITALPDGSAFFAVAPPASAKQDAPQRARDDAASAEVRYVPAAGPLGPRISVPDGADVRVLVAARDRVWAGTSVGLFALKRSPDGSIVLARAPGIAPMPVRSMIVDPTQVVWIGTDRRGDIPAYVVGYRPDTEMTFSFLPREGVPEGESIDALALTDRGELVVLVGSTLVKGKVFVPGESGAAWSLLLGMLVLAGLAAGTWFAVFRHPVVLRIRARPVALMELPLSALPGALRHLGRARALSAVWRELELPAERSALVQQITAGPPADRARAFAALLGMANAERAEVRQAACNIWSLSARFPSPEQLRNHPIPLLVVSHEGVRDTNPALVQNSLDRVLADLAHRFEYPFLLLCRDRARAREIVPPEFSALVVSEDIEREFLFARSPERTLAGLLHTRGLLTLSPYSEASDVKDPMMFFGRDELLRDLLSARAFQCLLVGRRRVGKTSLLRRIERELSSHRADVEVFFLDLLGKSTHAAALEACAAKLGVAKPAGDPSAMAGVIADRVRDTKRPIVLLLDETDALVEADAAIGFPLLSALRRLQADGLCSFLLAGYWNLYRRALDHASPLYNFAPVRVVGPLDADAARELVVEPMLRIGVRYEDDRLVERVVALTGGYPDFIQLLCDQMLNELHDGQSLVLTRAHLEAAAGNARIRDRVTDSFHWNTSPLAKILVYQMLEQPGFSRAEAHAELGDTLDRECSLAVVESLVSQLVLYGILTASGNHYTMSIPLLRETLRAEDHAFRVAQLIKEMPSTPDNWLDVSPRPT